MPNLVFLVNVDFSHSTNLQKPMGFCMPNLIFLVNVDFCIFEIFKNPWVFEVFCMRNFDFLVNVDLFFLKSSKTHGFLHAEPRFPR